VISGELERLIDAEASWAAQGSAAPTRRRTPATVRTSTGSSRATRTGTTKRKSFFEELFD